MKPRTVRALIASSVAGLVAATSMLVAQPMAVAVSGPAPGTQQACTDPAWNAGTVYVGGDQVSHDGNAWRAKWWTLGEEPGTTGEWGVWEDLGPCDQGPPPTDPPPSTGPPPDGPGVPGPLTVTGTTSSSISLSWQAAAGTVTGYRVYEGDTLVDTVSETSTTITGLDACASHTFAVSAFHDTDESGRSDPVSATTAGCQSAPLPRHFLTGYWHNFVNPAVELRLGEVPDEYDLIAVAFAEATDAPGQISFGIDPALSDALGGYSDDAFKVDVQTLKARGKRVIISVGGELGRIRVDDPASANRFADSVHAVMQEYGFDGVDIDLEHGIDPTHMGQALRSLHSMVGSELILTMAPQTIDMQSTQGAYFQLALEVQDILTVVHTQYYNSGSMLGCDHFAAYSQGTLNFLTALPCIQLENGLRADQVALGLPAGPGAAGGGVVPPSMVNDALDCLARGTNCGSFQPPRTYPDIRGAMTWSINWDVANGNTFARTVHPHLQTLP